MKILLASTSPRRREILALLGVPFEVVTPAYDEVSSPHVPIREEVVAFALGKAQSVAVRHPGAIVIGSDTMIELAGDKIGKPNDRADAAQLLRRLSGKTHTIYTSLAIVDGAGGPGLQSVEEVSVTMRPLTQAEIERYLDLNESLDKAGAYSVQGQGHRIISAMKGDYLAAVGMPLKPIAAYLIGRGLAPRIDVDKLYAEKLFRDGNRFS